MHLVIRKTVQSLRYRLIGKCFHFTHRLPLDQFCRHGAGGNGTSAAEGFKFHILNDVVLDLQVHLHDIAAFGISDLSDAVGIFDNSYIPRIAEMIHYFFAV